jgi:hypothetical protein
MSIKNLRRYLQEQFDHVADLDRKCDPNQSINLEVGDIIEEARRRCCEHGFQEVGEVATSLSPRSALPILGKLLTWARGQKSGTDALTPPNVAKMLGVNTGKVLSWIRTGQLKAANVTKKPGGRPKYRILPADLEVFLARLQPTPAPVRTPQRKRKLPPGMIDFYPSVA